MLFVRVLSYVVCNTGASESNRRKSRERVQLRCLQRTAEGSAIRVRVIYRLRTHRRWRKILLFRQLSFYKTLNVKHNVSFFAQYMFKATRRKHNLFLINKYSHKNLKILRAHARKIMLVIYPKVGHFRFKMATALVYSSQF